MKFSLYCDETRDAICASKLTIDERINTLEDAIIKAGYATTRGTQIIRSIHHVADPMFTASGALDGYDLVRPDGLFYGWTLAFGGMMSPIKMDFYGPTIDITLSKAERWARANGVL